MRRRSKGRDEKRSSAQARRSSQLHEATGLSCRARDSTRMTKTEGQKWHSRRYCEMLWDVEVSRRRSVDDGVGGVGVGVDKY